jgi:curved DNA-binding protein CbpA
MSTHNVPDPYAALGVPRDATRAEISHAYRDLLRATHPDTRDEGVASVQNASFAQALGAYAVLRDPQRRAEYDRHHPYSTPARGRSTPGRSMRPETPSPTQETHAATPAGPPIQAGPVYWRPSVR